MNLDSTLAVTNTCPKDGVHLLPNHKPEPRTEPTPTWQVLLGQSSARHDLNERNICRLHSFAVAFVLSVRWWGSLNANGSDTSASSDTTNPLDPSADSLKL